MKRLSFVLALGPLSALVLLASHGSGAPPAPTLTAVAPIQKPTVVVPQAKAVTRTVSMFVPATGKMETVLVPPSKHYVPLHDIASDYIPVLRQDPYYCVGTDTCRFGRMPYYNQANPNFAYVKPTPDILTTEKFPLAGTRGMDAQGHYFLTLNNPAGVQDPYFESWMPLGPFPSDQGSVVANAMSDICGPTAEAMAVAALLAAKSPATTISNTGDVWTMQHPPAAPGLPSTLVLDRNTKAMVPGFVGAQYNPLPGQGWQMTRDDIGRVHAMAEFEKTDPTWGGKFDYFLSMFSTYDPRGRQTQGSPVDPSTLVGLLRARSAIVLSVQFYAAAVVTDATGHKTITFDYKNGHAIAVDGFDGADTGPTRFFIHDPMYGRAYHRPFYKLANNESPTLSYQLPEGQTVLWNMTFDPFDSPGRQHVADITNGQTMAFLTAYYALSMQ